MVFCDTSPGTLSSPEKLQILFQIKRGNPRDCCEWTKGRRLLEGQQRAYSLNITVSQVSGQVGSVTWKETLEIPSLNGMALLAPDLGHSWIANLTYLDPSSSPSKLDNTEGHKCLSPGVVPFVQDKTRNSPHDAASGLSPALKQGLIST